MPELTAVPPKVSLMDLSSSELDCDDPSDSDDSATEVDGNATYVNKRPKKKKKIYESQANLVLPPGFLDPLPPKERSLSSSALVALALPMPSASKEHAALSVDNNSKKFWKAGDYEGAPSGDWESSLEKFLHYPSQTSKSAKMQSVSSGKARSSENKFLSRSKSLEKSSRNGHLQNKDTRNKISGKSTSSLVQSSPSAEDASDGIVPATNKTIHESRYLQKSLATKRLCEKDGSLAFHSSPESRGTEVQQNSSKNGKHLNLDKQAAFRRWAAEGDASQTHRAAGNDDEADCDVEASTESSQASRDNEAWELEDHAPGGPLDPSLLTGYLGHVASYIWEGKERGAMTCHSQMLRCTGWRLPIDIEARDMVEATGLAHLPGCMFQHLDVPLISAFVERWHPETNSFHMPWGEMTITLHDVRMILGVPVMGRVVSQTSERLPILWWLRDHLYLDMKSLEKDWKNGGVRFVGLEVAFEDSRVSSRDVAAAHILHILGSTLFVNRSSDKFTGHLVPLMQGGHSVSDFAWGTATLAYLYRQLGMGSRFLCMQLCGCLTLLQAWIYEHFPSFRPGNPIVSWQLGQPWALRWRHLTVRAPPKDSEHLRRYRMELDDMRPEQVIFMPYHYRDVAETRVSKFHGCIQFMDVVEPYMPHRVLRQFGYVQTIPKTIINPEEGTSRHRDPKKYRIRYNPQAWMWQQWTSHLLSHTDLGERTTIADPSATAPDYMDWFTVHSHIRVQNPDRIPPGFRRPEQLQLSPVEVLRRTLTIMWDCREDAEPALPDGEFRSRVHQGIRVIRDYLNGPRRLSTERRR